MYDYIRKDVEEMMILAAILVFAFLVVIHELGHFILAKLNGIKVEEFSVGMGPKLFSVKKGETVYSLRAIPLGGFCSMMGENEEVDDHRAFNSKSIFARFTVLVAGSFMNILFTILVLSLTFTSSTIIDQTMPGLPAETAGIQAGDKIIRINEVAIHEWTEIKEVVTANAESQLEVEVLSNGETKILNMKPQFDENSQGVLLGIVPKAQIDQFSIVTGVKNTYLSASEMLKYLGDVITRKATTEDIVGPVGIMVYLGDAAKSGFLQLLLLASVLSLNLAVINLLPLPALDGGRCLLLFVELIRGKKIPPEKEGLIHFVGIVALMMLSVVIIFRDLIRFNIFG